MKPVNGSGQKRAALINDLSCFGKCSLSVALPIVPHFGVEAVALPTAVLSTHTGGFDGYVMRDMTREMGEFADHWERLGLKFDCIYTGFFGSAEQLELAERFIDDFADETTLVMVDPVLGDNGSLYGCFTQEFVEKMRALAARADIITPNCTEAALLAGLPADAPAEELLGALKNKSVVITGVRSGDEIGYLARLGGRRVRIMKPYADISLHGTGDVFASALCGAMLTDGSAEHALETSAQLCDECIRATLARQPAHWYGLAFEDVLRRRGI